MRGIDAVLACMEERRVLYSHAWNRRAHCMPRVCVLGIERRQQASKCFLTLEMSCWGASAPTPGAAEADDAAAAPFDLHGRAGGSCADRTSFAPLAQETLSSCTRPGCRTLTGGSCADRTSPLPLSRPRLSPPDAAAAPFNSRRRRPPSVGRRAAPAASTPSSESFPSHPAGGRSDRTRAGPGDSESAAAIAVDEVDDPSRL